MKTLWECVLSTIVSLVKDGEIYFLDDTFFDTQEYEFIKLILDLINITFWKHPNYQAK